MSGTGPKSNQSDSGRGRLLVWGSVFVVLLTFAALCWWGVLANKGAGTKATVVETPDLFLIAGLPPRETLEKWEAAPTDFVGTDRCAECHGDRVEQFRETDHYRTSRPPDSLAHAEIFPDNQVIYRSRNPGLWFRSRMQNGKPIIEMKDNSGPVGQESRSATVDLVFGAGNADEIYHSWQDGQLFMLPIAYLHPRQEWANAPGFLDATNGAFRPVVPRCLECHVTHAAHRPGTRNEYHRVSVIDGIGCERCHGPGRSHVELHQSEREIEGSQQITLPSSLPRDRQMDVCGQCHSNTTQRRSRPFAFRPGDKVTDHFRIDLNQDPEFDHTANHVRYLSESRCFQNSKEMTCTSCHDPHHRASSDSLVRAVESCLQCHETEACGERIDLPPGLRDRCLDCHMPKRLVMSVTFDTATEDAMPLISRTGHRISVDRQAGKLARLQWLKEQIEGREDAVIHELTDELMETSRATVKTLLADHRILAALGELRRMEQVQSDTETLQQISELGQKIREVRLLHREAQRLISNGQHRDAVAVLEQLLLINPAYSAARAQLGTQLAILGEPEAGKKQLNQAAQEAPDDPYAYAMLGWLSYLERDHESADKQFDAALTIAPTNAKLLNQAGLNRIALEQYEDALQLLEKAESFKPNDVGILSAQVQALAGLNRWEQALSVQKKIVVLTDLMDPGALRELGRLFGQLKQYDLAIDVLKQAIRVAGRTGAGQVFQLQELKAGFERQSAAGSN